MSNRWERTDLVITVLLDQLTCKNHSCKKLNQLYCFVLSMATYPSHVMGRLYKWFVHKPLFKNVRSPWKVDGFVWESVKLFHYLLVGASVPWCFFFREVYLLFCKEILFAFSCCRDLSLSSVDTCSIILIKCVHTTAELIY